MHVSMRRVATRPACNRGMAHVRKRMRLVCAQCDAYAPVSSHTCGDQTFVAPAHPVPCTICGLLVGGLRDGSRGRGSSQPSPYTSTSIVAH